MAGQIHRNKKSGEFVVLDTHALRNTELSLKAKGLHSYLMQLPNDWKVNIADLTNRSDDGRDSVSSAMKELIDAGYVVRLRVTDLETKRFEGYDYHIFERPEHGKAINGKAVNGFSVNGKSATNKYYSNQELINQELNIMSDSKKSDVANDPITEKLENLLTQTGATFVDVTPTERPKKREKKENENQETITRIINLLNEKAKKTFDPYTKEYAKIINARLKEGRSYEDFEKIIRVKSFQWVDNVKMRNCLKPTTLFIPAHFADYLAEFESEAVFYAAQKNAPKVVPNQSKFGPPPSGPAVKPQPKEDAKNIFVKR